jgi:D-serine deaminase-like pyridoxal phosphate-dependent protein
MKPRWTPARVGDALHEVDTPALILDLDRFEANLERLMRSSTVRGMRVRPHAKSHKCIEIARRQMEAGAVGICCQKVSEAEIFLAGGIDDVLVTNEIIGKRKVTALASLAVRYPKAKIGVCVDDVRQVRQLATACRALAAELDIYIELDVGHGRAGVPDTPAVVDLAREIKLHKCLRLRGLQAYYGSAQHRRSVRERRQAITAAAGLAGAARDGLLAEGLTCDIVTGGGTGTFPYETGSGVYNEVQPGSYVLMDIDYGKNEFDPIAPAFEPALYIIASVMSARGDRVTLDAGLKAFSTDSGPAMPAFEGWQVRGVSDEHTVLIRVGSDGPALALGDKPLLIPGHIDPTINLHDVIVVSRNDVVIDLWPIEARGALF